MYMYIDVRINTFESWIFESWILNWILNLESLNLQSWILNLWILVSRISNELKVKSQCVLTRWWQKYSYWIVCLLFGAARQNKAYLFTYKWYQGLNAGQFLSIWQGYTLQIYHGWAWKRDICIDIQCHNKHICHDEYGQAEVISPWPAGYYTECTYLHHFPRGG